MSTVPTRPSSGKPLMLRSSSLSLKVICHHFICHLISHSTSVFIWQEYQSFVSFGYWNMSFWISLSTTLAPVPWVALDCWLMCPFLLPWLLRSGTTLHSWHLLALDNNFFFSFLFSFFEALIAARYFQLFVSNHNFITKLVKHQIKNNLHLVSRYCGTACPIATRQRIQCL